MHSIPIVPFKKLRLATIFLLCYGFCTTSPASDSSIRHVPGNLKALICESIRGFSLGFFGSRTVAMEELSILTKLPWDADYYIEGVLSAPITFTKKGYLLLEPLLNNYILTKINQDFTNMDKLLERGTKIHESKASILVSLHVTEGSKKIGRICSIAIRLLMVYFIYQFFICWKKKNFVLKSFYNALVAADQAIVNGDYSKYLYMLWYLTTSPIRLINNLLFAIINKLMPTKKAWR